MGDLTPEQRRRVDALLKPKHSPRWTNLAGIEPRNPAFLWWPYLPLGSLVIVAGAPGHGKSQFAAWIAAEASKGSLYPGNVMEPSRVLMLCAEDNLATTVVPRLLAVNADVRMIDTVNIETVYPSGLTANGMIRLPGDAELIHEWAKRHIDARLVVLDPVASFFSRDNNALINQDVRDALGPLVAVAEAYGVTIVIILHLNKSESKEFTARIAESHGFQAMARSVLALGPDPDDPDGARGAKKVIAITKANLIKPGTYGIRCEVRSVTLEAFTPPIETSELALLGKCEINADDLLMPSQDRTARMEVLEWLEALVPEAGWIKVNDAKGAAKSDGWSWRVVDRVARSRGYQRVKQPGVVQGPWWLGGPKALARAIPGEGSTLEPLESSDPQETKETKGDPSRGITREGSFDQDNGKPIDLDAYRDFERRKLGERDDDD